jgi:hypothetical protein
MKPFAPSHPGYILDLFKSNGCGSNDISAELVADAVSCQNLRLQYGPWRLYILYHKRMSVNGSTLFTYAQVTDAGVSGNYSSIAEHANLSRNKRGPIVTSDRIEHLIIRAMIAQFFLRSFILISTISN